jgi:hypothetical protein
MPVAALSPLPSLTFLLDNHIFAAGAVVFQGYHWELQTSRLSKRTERQYICQRIIYAFDIQSALA